ncbi:MAG: hypothetical protein JWN98_1361 [Abditibacteriota bacterium]|nr:hypothetical protein [Abditibacteriota bacterium]
MAEDIKKHPEPVWRDKANYTLIMKIDSEDDVLRHEELWARQMSDEHFQICCIPFFIYDIHLGDVVQIRPHNGKNLVQGVLEPSGHHTFRVWFTSFNQAVRSDVLAEVKQLGCLTEWFSDQLLAVDAADDAIAVQVAQMLEERTERGELDYETGRTE